MEINPASIDVNIHPTKLEVKFENEQELYIELRDFLKRKLLNSSLIGKYETYDNKVIQPKLTQSMSSLNETTENISTNKNDLNVESYKTNLDKSIQVVEFDTQEPIDTFMCVNDILKNEDIYKNNMDTNANNRIFKAENIKEDSETLLIKDGNLDLNQSFSTQELTELDRAQRSQDLQKSLENSIQKEPIQEVFFEDNEDNKFSLARYNVIGTIFDTYIILSKGSSMYLLDQHAAHERVLYEKYMDKFYKCDINMQMLLDPIVLELSNVDMLQVEKNLDLFVKFGFEIEIFGNNHIMIRCVPTVFGVPESEKFILQIIDNIDEIKNNYELKGEKFASMACRSAIKANDKIKTLEINSLFKQMEECINPFTCPHGRPIIVEISKNEIEKMFKRIM
jgi:DNA mismatch repair protein MutL